jgi:hypothetical protein
MRKSEVSVVALVAAVVLGAVAFMLGPLRFGWTPTLASGIILLVLLAYDRSPVRSFAQSLAYGAACGFLLVTAAIFPLYQFVPQMTVSPTEVITPGPWLPAIWLAGAVIFLGIDRVRQGSKPVVLDMSPPRIETAPSMLVATPISEQPVEPIPVPPPAPEPLQPAPPPLRGIEVKPQPAPKGTPATVYLNLVGTGIACLRAVKAEYLGRDFYRIVEPVPSGESWEFQTGQIVRCRKRMLSSGKAMVAYEEAPRAS